MPGYRQTWNVRQVVGMTDDRRLWPLVADRMDPDTLHHLSAVLDEWAGVPLHSATVGDLDAALRSVDLFRNAAINVYAEKLAGTGMADVETHANGDQQ